MVSASGSGSGAVSSHRACTRGCQNGPPSGSIEPWGRSLLSATSLWTSSSCAPGRTGEGSEPETRVVDLGSAGGDAHADLVHEALIPVASARLGAHGQRGGVGDGADGVGEGLGVGLAVDDHVDLAGELHAG